MPTLSAANCVALTGRSEELGVIEAGLSAPKVAASSFAGRRESFILRPGREGIRERAV
jgi:hypothetical protein